MFSSLPSCWVADLAWAAKLWHVLQDIVPHSCLWCGRWKYHWKSSCPLDVTYGSDALVIERWQRHRTEHVIDSWQILIPLSPSSTDVTDAMCTFLSVFSYWIQFHYLAQNEPLLSVAAFPACICCPGSMVAPPTALLSRTAQCYTFYTELASWRVSGSKVRLDLSC